MTRSILINAVAFLAATGCTPEVHNEYDIDITVESPEDTATDTDTGTDEPDVVTYHVPDQGLQIHETTTRLEFVAGEHFVIEVENGPIDLDCTVVTLRVPADASQGVIIKTVWYGALASDFGGGEWYHGLASIGTGHNTVVAGNIQLFRDPNDLVAADAHYGQGLYNSGPIMIWEDLFIGTSLYEHALRSDVDYFVPVGSEVGIGFCMGWNPWPNWDSYPDFEEPEAEDFLSTVLGNVIWTPANDQDFQSVAIQGLTTPLEVRAFDE